MGSCFSGVGGFDLAFQRTGFDVLWQVEIDGDCCKVLARHWPTVRRVRDINAVAYGRAKNREKHGLTLEPVDVLVGGFPCQDLSVAGKRKGLSGARSGLFFAFMRMVRLLKPSIVVLENVPGLLSSHGGRDFHAVLAAMAECGLRRAYRILDSQYFGVAQRRRRVFVVGCARESGIDPAAILFESAGGDGDSPARDSARPRVAASLRGRSANAGVNVPGRGGEDDVNLVSVGVHANQRGEIRTSALAGSLNGSRSGKQFEGVYALDNRDGQTQTQTLRSEPHGANPMVYQCHGSNVGPMDTLRSGNGNEHGGVPFVLDPGERERALVGSMHKRHDDDTDTLIAATLNSGRNSGGFRTEPGEHLVASSILARDANTRRDGMDNLVASAVTASAGHHGHSSPRGDGTDNLVASTLASYSGGNQIEANYKPQANGVRRLTPLECERLQGFPDGFTCLCGQGHRGTQFCSCPDTPRYKALGNAVTVSTAEWIARQIKAAIAERVT